MRSCLTDNVISDACHLLIKTVSKIVARSIVHVFQEINTIIPPQEFFFICKHFQIMHLSKSSRLGGGGEGGEGGIGQGFYIFQNIAVKFPTSKMCSQIKLKFPTPENVLWSLCPTSPFPRQLDTDRCISYH